ncbi:MAG: molecular chaperone DnaJ [Acidimicrobiaceae bacterium]|nr:molecular chaperone DnaJ [Acidimicrobiaceae bacterium]
MAVNEDFYALLGVGQQANEDELKKAYRKLARELHPDANPGDPEAEERFKAVTLAYETLRDPERRRRYDMFGPEAIRGTGAGGSGTADPFAGFGATGLGDLFDAFFGGASPFGAGAGAGGAGGAGARRGGRPGPPPGEDSEAVLDLDFADAVFGVEQEISVRIPVPCSVCDATGARPGTSPVTCTNCNGTGELRRVRQSILGQMVTASPCTRCGGTGQEIASPCGECRGQGRRNEERTFMVEVPAGVDNGSTLRLPGRGAAGPRGGPPGDLYVHLRVHPHARMQRSGNDLHHELHLAMTQASLGVTMPFETLDGSEELTFSPGTQSGQVVRLRGRGVPVLQGRGRGDLLITVVVDVPTDLTKEQEELLRNLAAQREETVAPQEAGLFSKIRHAFK